MELEKGKRTIVHLLEKASLKFGDLNYASHKTDEGWTSYSYKNIVDISRHISSALLDLGLTAISLIAAVAAYLHSGSLFLGLWSLFLIQALFAWVPVDWQRRPSKGEPAVSKDRFQTAYQVADNAVRQLATH